MRSLHLMATTGTESEVSLTSEKDPTDGTTFRVTPTFENASDLTLAFFFNGVQATVHLQDEQPIVVKLPQDGGGARVGVLTARYLRSEDDLRRIFECKKRQVPGRAGT